jgi:hypothetical protein
MVLSRENPEGERCELERARPLGLSDWGSRKLISSDSDRVKR